MRVNDSYWRQDLLCPKCGARPAWIEIEDQCTQIVSRELVMNMAEARLAADSTRWYPAVSIHLWHAGWVGRMARWHLFRFVPVRWRDSSRRMAVDVLTKPGGDTVRIPMDAFAEIRQGAVCQECYHASGLSAYRVYSKLQ